MSVSEARMNANQENAKRSTGPRTPEGKSRSKLNAVKHGLSGEGDALPPGLAAEVRRRTAGWSNSLRPADDHEMWLLERVALCTVRLDRIASQLSARGEITAARAGICWDADRKAAIEEVGARLSRNPTLVVGRLRRSRHGCQWLLERWRGLGRTLDEGGPWHETQRSMALDLLAVPPGTSRLDPRLPEGASAEALKELVRGEIEALEAAIAGGLDALDETEQALAEAGLSDDDGPETRLLRRYEAAALRELKWAMDQLQKGKSEPSTTRRMSAPEPEPEPTPPLAARPEPTPPPPPAPAPRPAASTFSKGMAGGFTMASAMAPQRPLNHDERRAQKRRDRGK